MIHRIDSELELRFDKGCYIEFASVSTVKGKCAEFSVYLNDELVERVHVNVPHSWWKNAGQQIVPTNPTPKDVIKFTTDLPVDLRLDIIYP